MQAGSQAAREALTWLAVPRPRNKNLSPQARTITISIIIIIIIIIHIIVIIIIILLLIIIMIIILMMMMMMMIIIIIIIIDIIIIIIIITTTTTNNIIIIIIIIIIVPRHASGVQVACGLREGGSAPKRGRHSTIFSSTKRICAVAA